MLGHSEERVESIIVDTARSKPGIPGLPSVKRKSDMQPSSFALYNFPPRVAATGIEYMECELPRTHFMKLRWIKKGKFFKSLAEKLPGMSRLMQERKSQFQRREEIHVSDHQQPILWRNKSRTSKDKSSLFFHRLSDDGNWII